MANKRRRARRPRNEVARYNLNQYVRQRVEAIENNPFAFSYNSPTTSYRGKYVERPEDSYASLASYAYRGDSVVAACMRVRRDLFRQAKFCWREVDEAGPGKIFRTDDLKLLDTPWPNGTTGELLSRMITDVDLCGNSFIHHDGNRLRWLRPDWVSIVLSGDPQADVDIDVLGYVYTPGGSDAEKNGHPYQPDEICHWAPEQDPLAFYRGMSWVSKALEEVQGDRAATTHKMSFFRNGATLGPIVRVPAGTTMTQFKEFMAAAEEAHAGASNAYKTMYLGGGAEVTLAAADFRQLDLKSVQGGMETRIAAVAGVHPVLVGLSEGLAGSSLNSGNFAAARRATAEMTLYSLWQDACGALQAFFDVPKDAELWIRERDIPFLREEAKDRAEIFKTQVLAIEAAMRAGFKPDPAVQATLEERLDLLIGAHTGLFSVQMQPPRSGMEGAPPLDVNGDGQPEPPGTPIDFGALRSDLWIYEDEEIERAVEEAFGDLDDEIIRDRYDVRVPAGFEGGGRFRKLSDRLIALLNEWAKGEGPDDPLDEYSRDQLRRVAKELADKATAEGNHERAARLTPRRGASSDEIKLALYKDVRGHVRKQRDAKAEAPKRAAKFTGQGEKLRDVDVAVYRLPGDKPALYRENDAGKRGRLVKKFDSLDDMAQWADDNGEPRVAQWARKEGGHKAPANPAAPDIGELSSDEMQTLVAVSHKTTVNEGGWVSSSDLPAAQARHLDGLAEKGWLQKEGGLYRIDPRGYEARQGATETGALVGDVLPAIKPAESTLPLRQVNRGAIIEGHIGKDGTFTNEATPGSRPVRVVVQRMDPLDQNGQPITSGSAVMNAPAPVGGVGGLAHFHFSGENPQVRIVGHDADTGRRIESAVVPANSRWSWHMNPSDDTSADIEGEIVPERPRLSGGGPALSLYSPTESAKLRTSLGLDMAVPESQGMLDAEARRRVETVLDDVDEMLAGDGSDAALLNRLEGRRKLGAPASVVDELTAAVNSGDRDRVRQVSADIRGRLGGGAPKIRQSEQERIDWAKYRDSQAGAQADARKLAAEERAAEAKGMTLAEWRASQAKSPTPAKKAPGRAAKLTARDLSSMSADDIAQAARDGRVTPRAAAKEIREIAQGRANHLAFVGLGKPDSEVDPDTLAEREAGRAEVAGLRALADQIEAPGRAAAKVAKPAAVVDQATFDVSSLDGLTIRQKRARLKAMGFSPERIDEIAPTAAMVKKAAASVPKGPRPSGLPTDRRPAAGDFEDLADRIRGLSEQRKLEIFQDLNATELAALARRYDGDAMLVPGWYKVSGRRQGLKLPPDLSLDEKRQWLAKHLSSQRIAWRSEDLDPNDIIRTDGDASDVADEVDDEEAMGEPVDEMDLALEHYTEDDVERAAGHDVTPGHDELHHYWTRGEGLAKWVGSPKPWTTLVAHLTKHVGPEKAKVFASRWFIEVFGFAAGSDMNRVTHGKPPRGERVGPG